jgi:ABC-2 type transport system permease protein
LLNLIKNELIKILANKKLYVGMAIIVVVNLLPLLEKLTGSIGDIPINGQVTPLYMLSTYLNILMPIFISVLIADMVTDEYVNGTLALSLIHPVSRSKLMIAKVLALVVIITLVLLFSLLVGFVLGSLIFGWGEQFVYQDVVAEINYTFTTFEGLLVTLGSYAISVIPLLAFGMLIFLLSHHFKGGGALVGISIGLVIMLSFLGEIAQGLRPFLINHYFALFKYTFLTKDIAQITTSILVLGIYSILPFALGIRLFKKKDIVY